MGKLLGPMRIKDDAAGDWLVEIVGKVCAVFEPAFENVAVPGRISGSLRQFTSFDVLPHAGVLVGVVEDDSVLRVRGLIGFSGFCRRGV